MPVAPIFAYIGTAVGASAATATATGVAVVGTAASVGATGYSMYAQNKAAKNAAAVDTAAAAYNAKYDEAMARQLDLDTIQNVRTQRKEGEVYLSKQRASYAAAGVLENSGSALASEITNAGRLEQQLQQQWVNSQQKQQAYYSKARVGVLEGEARAEADRAQGTLALINGGASLARQAFGAYESGVFNFGKRTTGLPAGADLF